MKGKLRHVAISVPDIEVAAQFYEKTFGMERINEVQTNHGNGISLSDGVVNLTVLNFPTDESAGDERGKDYVGLHHMGFIVEDLESASEHVVEQGGSYHKEIAAKTISLVSSANTVTPTASCSTSPAPGWARTDV